MTHRTIAEAIAWICTRDHEAVREIAHFPATSQLRVAMLKFLEGTWVPQRVRLEDPPPIETNFHATPNQALKGIETAMKHGLVAVWAYNVPLKEILAVGVLGFRTLELRACDDGRASCGLWSSLEQKLIWLEPLIFQRELEALWPAPSLAKTIKIRDHILAGLQQASNEKRIKKDDGLALAEGLVGYKRARFEEAWKLLSPDRKIGRGKRGPARP